jgi:hypothetical protein
MALAVLCPRRLRLRHTLTLVTVVPPLLLQFPLAAMHGGAATLALASAAAAFEAAATAPAAAGLVTAPGQRSAR